MVVAKRWNKIRYSLKGWRGSLKLLSILTWALAAANLAVSISMTTRQGGRSPGASVPILTGSCKRVNHVKSWTQVAINAASMALLAAANFSMQAWTALTRDEIDRVHRSGETVDVGIPSLRNMTRISLLRRILWAIMFLFATTIHLVYNSTLYSSSSASDYTVSVLTTEGFSKSFSVTDSKISPTGDASRFQRNGHQEWENITIPLLLQRYGTGFADDYRSVVLVSDRRSSCEYYSDYCVDHDDPPGRSTLYQGVMETWSVIPQTRWLCDLFDPTQLDFDRTGVENGAKAPPNTTCRMASIPNTTRPEWKVNLNQMAVRNDASGDGRNHGSIVLKPWALSENIESECRLLTCPLFWWLASSSNIFIAILLTGMAFLYKSTPLVTIGDVMDSYLCIPSVDFGPAACAYDFHTFKNIYKPKLEPKGLDLKKNRRLCQSVERSRWWLTVVWWLLVLFAVAVGFTQSWRAEKNYADNSMPSIFSRGFDSLRRISMLLPQLTGSSSPTRRLQLVVLSNLPQLGMAATYLLYNSLLTIMAVELEWNNFGIRHRSLRVSQPRDQSNQRDTFFLNLPYRFAIPLLILSGGLQWLVSQSLFFAEVDLWDENGVRLGDDRSIITLGYSHLALFWLLILGILAWLPAVLTGFLVRLPTDGMPLLGSCSAVVAASCHFPGHALHGERLAAAGQSLRWGGIPCIGDESVSGNGKKLGFSVGNLEIPIQGEVYG